MPTFPREHSPVAFARTHVETFELRVERRRHEIETGTHVVDEAMTRNWLANDEEQLAWWRDALDDALQAPGEEKPPE